METLLEKGAEAGKDFDVVLLQRLIADGMEWALILLPVMIYLLYLALWINWRRHPLMVSGPKSLFPLLFGLSGFFLIGPPSWVAHYFQRWSQAAYWWAFAGYAGLLVLVCALLLFRQRRVTVIYNVEPELFAEVLQEVLVEQEIPYSATPGRVSFNDGRTVLDVDSFPLLSNVSLRWRWSRFPQRKAIEAAMAGKLAESPTTFNLTCSLLTLFAGFLLIFIYFAIYLYWYVILPSPGEMMPL